MMTNIFGENLFDDWFGFPDFRDMDRAEKKLYGGRGDRLMKTDVHEQEDHYEIDIDLPGFAKEDISLQLEEGYLTVSATKAVEENKESKGKLIRQERFSGSMQRSFYLGENLTEEDIKATFRDGVLSLSVPKKEQQKVPEKKTIRIDD